jgi:predicted nucleotidyltransferase
MLMTGPIACFCGRSRFCFVASLSVRGLPSLQQVASGFARAWDSEMKTPHIPVPKAALAEFCRRNSIRRLALFGSVLRDDFTPESDVDVLVEFEPEARVGLKFFAMERELGDLLGRKMDLLTFESLNKYIRDRVLAGAQDQYVAA